MKMYLASSVHKWFIPALFLTVLAVACLALYYSL